MWCVEGRIQTLCTYCFLLKKVELIIQYEYFHRLLGFLVIKTVAVLLVPVEFYPRRASFFNKYILL